jgi:hypothetical protein
LGLGDESNYAHFFAAVGTGERIDLEDAAQQLGPAVPCLAHGLGLRVDDDERVLLVIRIRLGGLTTTAPLARRVESIVTLQDLALVRDGPRPVASSPSSVRTARRRRWRITRSDPRSGDTAARSGAGAGRRRQVVSQDDNVQHAEQCLPPLLRTRRLQVEAGIMGTQQITNGTNTRQAGVDSRGHKKHAQFGKVI